jgi:hypothetical protein
MGSFSHVSENGNSYYVVCQNDKEQTKRFDLPVAADRGSALSVGMVREKLYRVRCLVLAVCVCLWNNTAAYREGSIGKEKHQHRSPHSGVSHFSDGMVKVGSILLLTKL